MNVAWFRLSRELTLLVLDSAEPSTVKFVAHQGHVSMATVGVNGTIYMLEELEDGRMVCVIHLVWYSQKV